MYKVECLILTLWIQPINMRKIQIKYIKEKLLIPKLELTILADNHLKK